MDCYIVRIYRRNGKSARLFVGTVEEVGVGGKKGFTDFEELKGILEVTGREKNRSGGRRRQTQDRR